MLFLFAIANPFSTRENRGLITTAIEINGGEKHGFRRRFGSQIPSLSLDRDWKKKSRNRPCSRGLRLKTKRSAAVVDFAGLLKWGGGAYRGRTDDLLHAMQAL